MRPNETSRNEVSGQTASLPKTSPTSSFSSSSTALEHRPKASFLGQDGGAARDLDYYLSILCTPTNDALHKHMLRWVPIRTRHDGPEPHFQVLFEYFDPGFRSAAAPNPPAYQFHRAFVRFLLSTPSAPFLVGHIKIHLTRPQPPARRLFFLSASTASRFLPPSSSLPSTAYSATTPAGNPYAIEAGRGR